jgi:hypothetical protein
MIDRASRGTAAAAKPMVEALCKAIFAAVFFLPSCIVKTICGVDDDKSQRRGRKERHQKAELASYKAKSTALW